MTGQLIVDFDLRDASGTRIAKIAKNHVVHTSPEFEVESRPSLYRGVHKTSRQPYATVQEISPDTLKVTGVFCVNGFLVSVGDRETTVGGMTLSGNRISGFGTAIELRRNQLGIAFARRA